jgi:uncharacterized membrane protein
MKKLLFVFFALASLGLSAQTIKWPSGAATLVTPAYAATYSVNVANNLTYIAMDSLTGNLTLNQGTVTATNGAAVYIAVTAKAATRAVLFGTNIDGVTDSVATNKTVIYELMKLGGKLVYIGKGAQN